MRDARPQHVRLEADEDVPQHLLVALVHVLVVLLTAGAVPLEHEDRVVGLRLRDADQRHLAVFLLRLVEIFDAPVAVEGEELGAAPLASATRLEVAERAGVRVRGLRGHDDEDGRQRREDGQDLNAKV